MPRKVQRNLGDDLNSRPASVYELTTPFRLIQTTARMKPVARPWALSRVRVNELALGALTILCGYTNGSCTIGWLQ